MEAEDFLDKLSYVFWFPDNTYLSNSFAKKHFSFPYQLKIINFTWLLAKTLLHLMLISHKLLLIFVFTSILISSSYNQLLQKLDDLFLFNIRQWNAYSPYQSKRFSVTQWANQDLVVISQLKRAVQHNSEKKLSEKLPNVARRDWVERNSSDLYWELSKKMKAQKNSDLISLNEVRGLRTQYMRGSIYKISPQ